MKRQRQEGCEALLANPRKYDEKREVGHDEDQETNEELNTFYYLHRHACDGANPEVDREVTAIAVAGGSEVVAKGTEPSLVHLHFVRFLVAITTYGAAAHALAP